MTTLLMVRHGETLWNRKARLQGRTDVGLSELGAAQADACAAYIAHSRYMPLAAVYSSPLARALHTAWAIADRTGADTIQDGRLLEIDVGALSGASWSEVRHSRPEFVASLREDPINTVYPGGESYADVQGRAREFFCDVVRVHPHANIAVVAHAIILKALIWVVIGVEPPTHRRLVIGNASLSVAEVAWDDPGRGRLLRMNDRHYLEPEGLESPAGEG